jgi:4-hydroxybenzoate polyprenyltransferase
LAAGSIAAGNYVINEWCDREFDKFHPTKSRRSAVQRELRHELVIAEWLAFVIIGLGCAYAANKATLLIASAFALQGVVYNVLPRSKDTAYVDVISESINNPLRLMIGWAMVDPSTLPPSSIILAYWLGGAFLMAAKRLSEYREIAISRGKPQLVRYRVSFAAYSEVSLTVSCFVYGLLSSFFLATFLIKYRVEYLLLSPIIIVLFAYYLAVAMRAGSSAQTPERLFRERGLMLLIGLLVVAFTVTTLINIPALSILVEQHYIQL